MPPSTLYAGLDAGGTKTELMAAAGPGDEVVTLTGPAAQVQRVGAAGAASVLADLLREALARRPGATLGAVCAGLAGAGRPADQQAVAAALREALGDAAPARLLVVSDAEVAFEGAFEGEGGLLVIAGTGSIVLARGAAGPLLRAGGWGYLLGDEGSGYALGLHGLRAVAADLDGGPPTRLRALVSDRFGLREGADLIRRVYREGWPLQEAAPLVLDAARAGDEAAARIVQEQTHLLARQATWLAARAGAVPRRVAPAGGLTQDATYRAALASALEAHLPAWEVRPPCHRPVVGAWRMAVGPDASGEPTG